MSLGFTEVFPQDGPSVYLRCNKCNAEFRMDMIAMRHCVMVKVEKNGKMVEEYAAKCPRCGMQEYDKT